MKILFTTVLTFWLSSAFTQKDNVDSIYVENIRTVQLLANGSSLNFPAIELNGGSIMLTFDDMEADTKDYIYTIEQCDRDWNKSKLERLEYLNGYSEDRILSFQAARSTNIQYMNYRISVPNENMRVTKSGNYLLKVYHDDSGEKKLVIVRRFIVYEQIMIPAPIQTPASAFKFDAYQEFDISIDPKTFRFQNPMQDVRLAILQNRRWDNALLNVAPSFTQGDKLMFDYQDVITFPAGKEWRYVDLTSTRFRTERVQRIDQNSETWEYTLRTDLDRSREPYILLNDINGGYEIGVNERTAAIDPDYVDINFALLKKEALDTANVYIWGALTDYKIDERFKMEYDASKHMYELSARLKQGNYNYIYVTVPEGKKVFYTSDLEGNWYETLNEYEILIYYRPFGARQDRVIGFYKFTYNKK